MTTQDSYTLAISALIDEIAQRVVNKLIARQKKILVIFTGSTQSVNDALESLTALKAQGYKFSVILSRSAGRILDIEAIKLALEPENLWIENIETTPAVLASQYDTILVPSLTMSTAAKVAAIVPDTPASAIILDSMMRGKKVVLAIDGCCPDSGVLKARGYNTPEPMKQKLRDNLEMLKSYGAKMTYAKNIAEKIDSTVKTATSTEKNVSMVYNYTGGRVLSVSYVMSRLNGSTVMLPKKTLVTQLAADEAKKRNIKIQFMREGE